MKKVVVEFEVEDKNNNKELTIEEIEEDIKKSENDIGWNYYYYIKAVKFL